MKSSHVVLCLGAVFVFISVFRMFGASVPGLSVALISVVAALISLIDILEITKYKRYIVIAQVATSLFLVIAMIIWFLPVELDFKYSQEIGDGFTLLGLGLVIGLTGIKEILEPTLKKKSEKPILSIQENKFTITKNEYMEMSRINDIILMLKKLDQEILYKNRVHTGWALFYDDLEVNWHKWKGPFYDGMHREKYYEFLHALGLMTDKIGNVADTDYKTFRSFEVKMWDELVDITTQPRINNVYSTDLNEIIEDIRNVLVLWEEVKKVISERYEDERSEQISKTTGT